MPLSQQVDLCVIGAGAAGLSVAAGAAQLGIGVVLIEQDRMGGECLNTGCVPSKALLAAAKAAQMIRNAKSFGIGAEPLIDFQRVRAHLRSVIDAIAPHDSVERFEQLGVEVIRGKARFTGRRRIAVNGRELRAHRVVIATGSAPAVPRIPGLDQVPFFTNETIFDNDSLPRHLVILGGGPNGIEIGQAYRRLGAAVTIIERDKALSKDDPELARPLLQRLATEGVAIHEGADLKAVARDGDSIILTVEEAGQEFELRGSHLFIATGRAPRTSARGIYAVGDVVNGPRFTHVASYHAGIVIRNALFRLPARIDYRSLPWVTYTDPELAQVGMTEERARNRYGDKVRVLRVPYEANDRAQTERHTEGMLKLVADARGRVLGASILGTHAGELAHLWVVAIEQKLKLRHVAQMIAPYPTWGELDKAAAAEFFKPLIARPLTRAIARTLFRLP